jgi:hypothetical protein
MEGSYFPVLFILIDLIVCFLYFFLLALLEWFIIRTIGICLYMIDPTLFFSFLHKLFTITLVVIVKLISNNSFFLEVGRS